MGSGDINLEKWARWRLVVICFLAQNCAMGLAFGSFGALLQSTEEHFGVSRALASTGMSLMTLAIGGLAPVLGHVLQKISVRLAMVAAAVVSGLAYWGLTVAADFRLALFLYGVIGLGVVVLAILGPLTLLSRWFRDNRAKVLAIVNLPLFMFVTPYLVGEFLPALGREGIFTAMAALFVGLGVILLGLREHPGGAAAVGSRRGMGSAPAAGSVPLLTTFQIMARPAFWFLSLGIGLMAGIGTVFVVHVVPFGVEGGMPLQQASTLMSVYAGSGVFGLMLFGPLADRLGAATALVIAALSQSLVFWGFLQVNGGVMYCLAALFGLCSIPMVTLHGAALSELFSARDVSKAMGYSYSIKLPFLFSLTPVIGLIHDRTGNYVMAFTACAVLLLAAAGMFAWLVRAVRRERARAAA